MSWQDEEIRSREIEKEEQEKLKFLNEKVKLEINNFWDKCLKAISDIHTDIKPEVKSSLYIIGKLGSSLRLSHGDCVNSIDGGYCYKGEGLNDFSYYSLDRYTGEHYYIKYDNDEKQFYVMRNAHDSTRKAYVINDNSIEIILKNICTGKRFYEGLRPYEDVAQNSTCFIATAVYGVNNSPEILVLQSFRDKVLLPSYTGKIFVKLYYLFSPAIAHFISKNMKLKLYIKRFLLDPIVNHLKTNYRE